MTHRQSEFVVCVGDREVWRGLASGHSDATDKARACSPELRSANLNATSYEPAVSSARRS